MTLAFEVRARARTLGLPDLAAYAGLQIIHGLIHRGRLDDADLLLSDLVPEEGLTDEGWWLYARARLLALQGEAGAALPLERALVKRWRTSTLLPYHEVVVQHVEALLANDLPQEALDAAVEFASRASTTITEQALASWHGTFCLIAQTLRADLAGDPSVAAWRTATAACARIGAGLAVRPRLGLVAALLVAGERDEARTSLPQLVADARAMGAAGVVAEATRFAHRHRIPLSEEEPPSRLDVLTAREREVLGVLVTGATNRVIGEQLFISEKTVSVHVTNLLAKLGCANRGEAAALARELAPADSGPQSPARATKAPSGSARPCPRPIRPGSRRQSRPAASEGSRSTPSPPCPERDPG